MAGCGSSALPMILQLRDGLSDQREPYGASDERLPEPKKLWFASLLRRARVMGQATAVIANPRIEHANHGMQRMRDTGMAWTLEKL